MPAVVRIHMAAFPHAALTSFGEAVLLRYYHWQLTGPHDRSAVGLEDDRELVGFCFAGLFRGSMAGFLRNNRGRLARHMLLHPSLLFNSIVRQRLKSGLAILNPLRAKRRPSGSHSRPKSYGILAIAVHPRWQGLGAGKLLMEDAEARARKAGFHQMHLSVDTINQQAIRFYERLGWQRVVEHGGEWHGYMERPLRAAATDPMLSRMDS